MARKCVNLPNLIYYVCSEFTAKLQRNSVTRSVRKAYDYFGDQHKSWAPHSCCSRDSLYLRGWLTDTHQSMPFAARVLRGKQKDHLTDLYPCSTKIDGYNSKSKLTVVYPKLSSAVRRVQLYDSLQIPYPPQQRTLLSEEPISTSPEDEPGTFMFQCGP
jgi:hypothetical protein